MTKKIAFIGSAGSGKSTLATDVFTHMKKLGVNAELITEWIRYDIQMNGPLQNIWEQYRTLHHQRTMEDSVPETVEWMITDSGCLTPYFYSCLYTDQADERQRLVLSDMFKFMIDDLYQKRYYKVFFLPASEIYSKKSDIADDGTRYQTPEELEILDQHMTLVFSKMFKVDNVHVLDCPVSERTQKVLGILDIPYNIT